MTPVLLILLMLVFVGAATYAMAEWLASRLVRTNAKQRQAYGDTSDWYQ